MSRNALGIEEQIQHPQAALAARPETQGIQNRGTRRMALLQQAGLFGSDTKGAVIRRAVSLDDLRQAYRLVHDTFVKHGLAAAEPSGLRVGPFEALPTTATFVAAVGTEVVGAQSLVMDSAELRLPADADFRDEIDTLRLEGHLVCEVTSQAVAFQYRRSAVPTELMRCTFAHMLAIGCDELVIAVKPGHVLFYQMLGFEVIGSARRCTGRNGKVAVLLRWNMAAVIRRAERADEDSDCQGVLIKVRGLCCNPYRERVGAWQEEAHRLFADVAGLHSLFVEESGLLRRCTDRDRFAISLHWGDAVFAAAL